MTELRFLDLDLEAVTPLMSGGAWQQAEIRPPSFRGLMRYWLRALVGGIVGAELLPVSLTEQAVFGSYQHASPVALRVLRGAPAGPLPPAGDEFPGIGYLFYAAYHNRRDAVQAGERFQLRLQTRPLTPLDLEIHQQPVDDDLVWTLAAASLWLVARLGGLGLRMRRGAGSIRFCDEPAGWPAALPPARIRAGTPQGYAEEIAEDLAHLRRAFGWTPAETMEYLPPYTVLHPDCCQVYVLDQVYPSWQLALDAVGRAFQAFRSRQPDDYQAVKGVLTRQRRSIDGVKRSIFGLPLMFFFSSLYKQLVEQGVPQREARARSSATIGPRRGQTRSSPLWFRVVRLGADAPAYTVQLALFRNQFLSDGMLTLRPADRSMSPVDFKAPATYRYVQEWIDYLSNTVAPVVPARFV